MYALHCCCLDDALQRRTTKPLMKKIKGKHTRNIPTWKSKFRRTLVLALSSLSIILLTSQVTDLNQPVGEYLGQDTPGLTPELFAKDIIPDDLHSAPIFSPDGSMVYYKPLTNNGIMTMRMKNERWTSPVPLFVNDELDNSDDPCLNPRGDILFFSSYNKEENREYIYYCLQKEAGKCTPEMPAGKLNSLDLHWQISVADNGNIYSSSNGNIYCSVFEKGIYSQPVKLGTNINSEYSECTPYVSPDESMLIFSRANEGKPDLFVSYKDEYGNWSGATALGSEINTEHHEMCPSISPDGKYLFFLSSRGGLFSAYWVDAKVLDVRL